MLRLSLIASFARLNGPFVCEAKRPGAAFSSGRIFEYSCRTKTLISRRRGHGY